MSRITAFQKPVVDMRATGRKIKQLMESNALCVHDVQAVFGFSYPQAVYAWLGGQSLPTVDNLLVLSELFGVPVDTIVQRELCYAAGKKQGKASLSQKTACDEKRKLNQQKQCHDLNGYVEIPARLVAKAEWEEDLCE